MAVVNGTGAVVSIDEAGGTTFTEVYTTRGWRISYSAAQATSVPSNAGSGQIVTAGAKDFTGSFDFDGVDFPMYPGVSGNFLGYNTSKSAQGLIIAESATITCDVAGSGNVGGTVNFAGNGALTFGSTTDSDATDPLVYNSVGAGRVDWKPNGEAAYATLPDVTQWSLTLNRTLTPYVSTTSAGVTKRTAGSYGGSVSVSMLQGAYDYLSTTATAIVPGTMGRMLLYSTASTYFEVWFVNVTGNEFGAVPDENGLITIPGIISLGSYVSGTWTAGKVLKPGGAAAWFGSV